MKKIIIFLILLASIKLFAQVPAEIYNVVRVNGGIHNVTTGQDINLGNTLQAKDKLKFQQQSFAFVISGQKRKFALRNPYSLDETDNTFALAELSLNPIRSRGQLNTRGLVGETGVKDFKNYMGTETFNIIGNQLDIFMDKNMYPLNDDKFIVFYYKINDKQVSKKVGFDKQKLIVKKQKLFVSENDTLSSDMIKSMSIYQYEKSTGETNQVTKIDLVFFDKNDLRKEFLAIIPILKKQNSSTEEIKEYLVQYFFDIYGNVDEDQLKAFIDEVVVE